MKNTLFALLASLLAWPWRLRNDAHGARQARGYAAADDSDGAGKGRTV